MSEIIFDNPWPPSENNEHAQNSRSKSPTSTLGRNPWSSSIREGPSRQDSEDSFDGDAGEFDELTREDIWRNKFLARPPTYPERSTIGEFAWIIR